jgi:hypothetical protein
MPSGKPLDVPHLSKIKGNARISEWIDSGYNVKRWINEA